MKLIKLCQTDKRCFIFNEIKDEQEKESTSMHKELDGFCFGIMMYIVQFIQNENKRLLQCLYNLLMSLCVNENMKRFCFSSLQPPVAIAKSLLFPFNL